jgi:2-(1,2-epoxy-1,2-dihydrophenyl)acetyl-CoA isomerase
MTGEAAVLDVKREGRVAVLTLNRPDRLNALNDSLHEALNEAVGEAAQDRTIGAVVVTGAGRAFCAGGDIGGKPGSSPVSQELRIDRMIHHGIATRLLHAMPKPTLALLNGATAGAGLALALACDMRIAASDAIITTAYAKLALSGDFGCTWLLTRLVGPSIAADLMLLSEKISAERALQVGLINRVVAPERLLLEGMAIARQLGDGPPVTMRSIKRNIRAAEREDFDALLEREAAAMVRCTKTVDAKEALLARRESRPPIFVGY